MDVTSVHGAHDLGLPALAASAGKPAPVPEVPPPQAPAPRVEHHPDRHPVDHHELDAERLGAGLAVTSAAELGVHRPRPRSDGPAPYARWDAHGHLRTVKGSAAAGDILLSLLGAPPDEAAGDAGQQKDPPAPLHHPEPRPPAPGRKAS